MTEPTDTTDTTQSMPAQTEPIAVAWFHADTLAEPTQHTDASMPAPHDSRLAEPDMTEQQVRDWIAACNHEPARRVLRTYLFMRETPRPAPSEPCIDPYTVERDLRQTIVVEWGTKCFGADHMSDKIVRAARFFEEAAELVQAIGLPKDHALRAFEHVYTRAPGEPAQEAGGVGVTLMALCNAIGFSADACEEKEIARCLSKSPETFAARNKAKLEQVDARPQSSPPAGEGGIEAALNAYNRAWKEAGEIDSSNVEAVRRLAMTEAIAALRRAHAPAPSEHIKDRIARLLCYEKCRAATCKESERCCTSYPGPGSGGFESYLKEATVLLAHAPAAEDGR